MTTPCIGCESTVLRQTNSPAIEQTTTQKNMANMEFKNKHKTKVSIQKKTTIGLWSILLFVTVNLYTNSI